MSFVIPFPLIDPVALNVGPVEIKWYGLAYMFSLLLGWAYARYLAGKQSLWGGKSALKSEQFDDLLIWMTLGVVLGGRLGYVIFYNPVYFLLNPMDIFKTWNGGMSFHGGFLGSVLAVWLYSRRHKLSALSVMDVVAAVAPIGFFFGRLANFINGELWGRATDVSWAMIFPHPDAEGLPRHPSQLYEAALEGLVLFLVIQFLIYYRRAFLRPGLISGVMVMGYGLARIFVENFRQFDEGVGLMIGPLTPGMIYSVPMVLVGAYLIYSARMAGSPVDDKVAKSS